MLRAGNKGLQATVQHSEAVGKAAHAVQDVALPSAAQEWKVAPLRCLSGLVTVSGWGGWRLLPGCPRGCRAALAVQEYRGRVCSQVQLRTGLEKAEGCLCAGCDGLLECRGWWWFGIGSGYWMWLCFIQDVLECNTAITVRNQVVLYRSKFSLLCLTLSLH